MSELKFKGPMYKVTMTEYERGWGQRPMGEKFFDNEEEAKSFCEEWSDFSNPECYYEADYRKIV